MVDWATGLEEYKKTTTGDQDIDWGAGLAEYKQAQGSEEAGPMFEPQKPEQRYENIAIGGDAPFEAHAIAAASRKPEHIIRSYAQYRFPTLSTDDAAKRYWMENDEVWYLDNDGIERKEERATGLKKAIENVDITEIDPKRLAAVGLLELPPALVAGSTQLLTGSPAAAAVAAGGTRAIETGVAQLLADREPDYLEAGGAGAVESLSYMLGDYVAKNGLKALDNAMKKMSTNKPVAEMIGGEVRGLQLPEAMASQETLQRIAKENNISLDMAQQLQSHAAASYQKTVGQMGGAGAEILKEQSKKQSAEVYGALKKQITDISPGDVSRYEAGQKLTEVAEKAREGLINTRKAAADLEYTKAFQLPAPVETTPVIRQIDNAIEYDIARGGATENALTKVRAMLVRNAPENHPSVVEIDSLLKGTEPGTEAANNLLKVRKTLTEDAGILESRLKKLDSAKKHIDKIVTGPGSDKIPAEELVNLNNVRSNLVKQMDVMNPTYKAARETFAELSEPVNAFDKTILDVVRKLEGDRVVKAPARIFSSEFSDPATIKTAKDFIQQQDPQAWDASVRVFLEQTLDTIDTEMTGRGVADAFRRRVWKPGVRERLKVAMEPHAFKNMDEFFDLVSKMRISLDMNSDTTQKMLKAAELERLAGGRTTGMLRTAGKFTDFLKLNWRELAGTMEKAKSPEFNRELALALTMNDKEITNAVKKMKSLSPKSEKFMRTFSAMVSELSGRAAYKATGGGSYGSKGEATQSITGQGEQ